MPQIDIPKDFLCSISGKLMEDPVSLEDGSVFDRKNIESWFENNETHPVTKEPLSSKLLIPNTFAKNQIQQFLSGKTTCTPRQFFNLVSEGKLEQLKNQTYFRFYFDFAVADEHGMEYTPLMEACKKGSVELVWWLCQEGADINQKNNKLWNPLEIAAGWNNPNVIRLLLDLGAEKEATDDQGYTPLLNAVYGGHKEAVELLIKEGCNLNAQTKSGAGAIHLACERGHLDVLQLLVANEIDMDQTDAEGFSAIHYAAEFNKREILHELVKKGVSVDCRAKNVKGRTPLMLACLKNQMDCLKFLTWHEADVDAVDGNGDSALHIAAQRGLLEPVRYLMSEGASYKLKNKDGKTAADVALESKKDTVAEFINKYAKQLKREQFNSLKLVSALQNQNKALVEAVVELTNDLEVLKAQLKKEMDEKPRRNSIVEMSEEDKVKLRKRNSNPLSRLLKKN